MSHTLPCATILGYPRIGPDRELKRALEAYWAGRTSAEDLHAAAAAVRRGTRTRLTELGLDPATAAIPSDFAHYDQVLTTAIQVGAVPARFGIEPTGAPLGLVEEFRLARGDADTPPLELTKWFDSNYHYLVPEISPATPLRHIPGGPAVTEFAEALAEGVLTRPVLVGPVTFLLLAKPESPDDPAPLERLEDLLAVYTAWLAELARAGATWVQLDEPALVADTWDLPAEQVTAAAELAYRVLAAASDRPALLVAAPYGSLRERFAVLAGTGVEAIGIDLVRGTAPEGLPTAAEQGVRVLAGVVDGHNVWRTDLDRAASTVQAIAEQAGQVSVGTSTSLLHVPHTVAVEDALSEQLRSWLAFADEKVSEVLTLASAQAGEDVTAEFAAARSALAARAQADGVRRTQVRDRVAAVTAADTHRADYAERVEAQRSLGLPDLPTTTIGSFPQTTQLRQARARLRKGELSTAEYEQVIRAEIAAVIRLQEELGLDVLVHGEPERNDMVQYFAEHLDGFDVTQHGWVQSYGSRCTRPSLLWGDVSRPAPITPAWSGYAASLTEKPVKGMLTGPVTILAWSFVRDDLPLAEVASQVALALRDEVADLEAAGIRIVQVDEPALRELLPLRREDQRAYVDWSVAAFRLATGGAAPGTQVHTHLCYSEFGEIIDAIDGLDADVTSIEAARSAMEVVPELAAARFARGLGPGVWDIHSPRVPSVEEVAGQLRLADGGLQRGQLWANPDCGLKTRGYAETTAALTNLVAAAEQVRAQR